MEPYENTLSVDRLRAEVRRCWDESWSLNQDLLHLPEIPSTDTMRIIQHAAMNSHNSMLKGLPVWDVAKQMQRDFPMTKGPDGEYDFGPIPYKCEYERATGLWFFIRKGLLSEVEDVSVKTPCK